MKNMLREFQDFKLQQLTAQASSEARIRSLEDNLTRFDTIKKELVITAIQQRLDALEGSKISLTGGWKGMGIVIGVILTIIGLIINIGGFVMKLIAGA